MGTASIVLGMLGLCICWVPGLGWLGAVMGVLGCAAGVPSITRWYYKPGYAPWGISGLVLGVASADLSAAFQIKYTQGALDRAVFSISPEKAVAISIAAGALCAVGLVIARKKQNRRAVGILLTSAALVSLMAVGTSALVTADRQYEAASAIR